MSATIRRFSALVWSLALGAALCAAFPALAGALTPERVADAYLKSRNAALVSGPAASASLPAGDLTAQLASREQRVLEQLGTRRKELAASGERYTRATTTTRVLRREKTARGLLLRVEEHTSLDYANVTGAEPDSTSFTVSRDFSFDHEAAGWRLRDVQLAEPGAMAPVNEIVSIATGQPALEAGADAPSDTTPRATDAAADLKGAPRNVTSAPTLNYNYSAMAAYAERYVLSYNTAYRRFSNDCTNFISQAMRAGGWAMVSGFYQSNGAWWYNWANQSYPWAGAENWHRFALSSRRTYILSNVWSMGLADVLQLDFDRNGNKNHTMIVVSTTSSQKYLNYHTNDTRHRTLSSIISQYPSAWYYAHRT